MNQHIRLEPQAALVERERLIEMEMSGLGFARFQEALREAQQSGTETTTPGARFAMQSAIQPVALAIQGYLDGQKTRAGKVRPYLRQISSEVVAFITSKIILDRITTPQPRSKLAMAVGRALQDECYLSALEQAHPDFFRLFGMSLFRKPFKGRLWALHEEIHAPDIGWREWPEEDLMHIGQHCIEFFMKTTGLIESEIANNGQKDRLHLLKATPAGEALISERNKRCELLSPTFMPTIIPPRPWTAPHSGGYWFLPHPLPFVKKPHSRDCWKDLAKTGSMAGVYSAVNAMQETAWKVNASVLATMHDIWDAALPLGRFDFTVTHPLPRCQACNGEVNAKRKDHACFGVDKDAHTEWKRAASKVHAVNAKARSKKLQVAKVLWVADKFKDEAAIYFPVQLDFRGRAYSVPMHLNPQGADWSKGLLTFAHGKPITDARAAGWLMIHGANTYGFDKVSLEERVGWIEEHEAQILASAEAPLSETFWSDADKPWQFLAFCFEYAAFKKCGYGFVSTLPVALDGSCNGLQHFSALLRDPVGGKAVNLLPSEKPNDIYQTVCDRMVAKMKADGSPMALAWLALNPDRKLTKQPVMTLPYGSTQSSCREYVAAWLTEQHHSFDDTSEAVNYCAKLIWDATGEVVVAARQAMDWLQKAARAAAGDAKAIRWTAPDGLPVLQAYSATTAKVVETRLGDRTTVKGTLRQDTGKLDKRQQVNGISPNFVHSMDAAALRLYVIMAKDNGINSFALVHDSYGTLAADTDMSAACLREAFVNMYQGQNHLEALRTSLAASLSDPSKLPPVPQMGTLDLEQVRKADYFFA